MLQFAYDSAGPLTKLVNENRAVSSFDWDVMDRLIKEVGFDGRTQHYHYKELGLLTEHDDGQSDHWHRIRYSYDEQDRLSLRQWGRAEIYGQELFEQRLIWNEQHQLIQARHYHYDALGQSNQSQYYAYDPQGRLADARLGEHGAPVEHWQFDWAGNPLPALNAEQPKSQYWSERVRQHWQDPNINLLREGTSQSVKSMAYDLRT